MKAFHLFLLFLCMPWFNFQVSAQVKNDTLTNDKVITLTKMGLQSSVIINKIKSSVTSFDVSTNALINLSQNGVSSEVINEMMKIQDNENSNINNAINEKDPHAMHKAGIYIFNSGNVDEPLKRIQIVRVSSIKTSSGGYGGFGGTSSNAILTGVASKQQISDNNPIFYFYFNYENYSRADWFDNATSPNEFALVKVIEKKDQRLFNVGGGSYGGFGSSSTSGIPEKNKIPFDFEEISEGIYKVTIKTQLLDGEYCFVFAGEIDRVFDFGIHIKNK